MKIVSSALALSLATTAVHAGCPFKKNQKYHLDGADMAKHHRHLQWASSPRTGDGGVPDGGYAAVRAEIEKVLVTSQDFFPADFGNYAGLMIRLAWHCSGSYRASDGRGGCDGGRIRFDPELNWDDNANLNQALKLLEPVKAKFGSKLSWGDLIVLAGNTAISSTGGPILGFCGGRIDDADGSNSLKLGPSPEQEAIAPCKSIDQDGKCQSPLGPTTVGLIYVNPAGPIGKEGDTVASGADIREAFSRMGFNDTETVALVGGGHAYGKCHGACSDPPCGTGIGPDTFTSGFEGQWTSTPTVWSNEYFHNMFDFNWTLQTGPGGNIQYAPDTTTRSSSALSRVLMLTADLGLRDDPAYRPISESFKNDITVLENAFQHAWYRLTTADMGPVSRCIGDEVPDPQPFQVPLPPSPDVEPDYIMIRSAIQTLIEDDPDTNTAAFVNLAYRCASTYRDTDYRGGCNGARIRFEPESSWPSNVGTADALSTLEPIIIEYPDISYSDLIVLAGQTAIESAGGKSMSFCGGRVDALDGSGSINLEPRTYTPALVSIRDDMQVKGLSAREGVALAARPTTSTAKLSNQFFVDLLAAGAGSNFSEEEQALLEGEFKPIVEEYAANNDLFLDEFASAWTKMMIADRFNRPSNNVCDSLSHATTTKSDSNDGSEKDKMDDSTSSSWMLLHNNIVFTTLGVTAATSLFTLTTYF